MVKNITSVYIYIYIYIIYIYYIYIYTVAETWRRVWGAENFFRGPRFLNDAIFGQNSIFTAKISDDFF